MCKSTTIYSLGDNTRQAKLATVLEEDSKVKKDNNAPRPSETDSAPVRGDGYEPRSSKFRPRANAETSHSVRYDIVVVVASVVGGGEKFSHGMVRSQKPPLMVPLHDNSYLYTALLGHLYDLT